MHKQQGQVKSLTLTTTTNLAVSCERGCLASPAIDCLKWVPASIGILWHKGEVWSARGAINCSPEHQGSDRESTQRQSQKDVRRGEKECSLEWADSMWGTGEREKKKVVITQMGRYAPSIHPMLPYLLAHTTGVLIGSVHSVCSSTLQVWRRAL